MPKISNWACQKQANESGACLAGVGVVKAHQQLALVHIGDVLVQQSGLQHSTAGTAHSHAFELVHRESTATEEALPLASQQVQNSCSGDRRAEGSGGKHMELVSMT